MFENKPKFKETLWEWRAFSLKVDLRILQKICSLSEKSSKPTKMVDHYLFRSGCEINVKVRNEELRIIKKRTKGIEQWITEAYGFPISPVMSKDPVSNWIRGRICLESSHGSGGFNRQQHSAFDGFGFTGLIERSRFAFLWGWPQGMV